MEQLTPRDFLIHLKQGNFQAATDLANELQLDKDLIYKAQWTKQKEEYSVRLQLKDVELLKQIKDDIWVIGQCLDTCVESLEVQKAILSLGQSRNNILTNPILKTLENKQQDLTQKDKALLRSRLYFLKYSDRLQTFNKIWSSLTASANAQQTNDVSFASSYSQFRDSNLIAQAIEFARSENNIALDAIFMHHGSEILPQRLFILSQIPETTDPSRFDLPHVTHDHEDTWLEEPWRTTKDVVEQDWVQKLIKLQVQEETDYLERLNEGIETIKYPTTADVIADWYLERAHAADEIGLSSNALEISRYAKVMGVSGIESKISEYEWLCKYVYSRNNQGENMIDLPKFQQLSGYEVLEGLLSNTNSSNIIDDMSRLVLPWIEVCRKREKNEKPELLLFRWLLNPNIIKDHLDWCCSISEMSKPTIPLEDRIIQDDLDLSRLVLAISYCSNGSMDYLVRLFECLPIFPDIDENTNEITDIAKLVSDIDSPLSLFESLQSIGASGLTQMMDTLQAHLGSAETLARYHVSVPLRWYLQNQPVDAQRQLCIRMSSQAAGGVETGGAQFDRDDDWRELLDDMVHLCDNGQGIFGKLDQAEIFEIFFSSLLRCGCFKLAKDFILGSTKLMDITKAETLVIDAEREFFDNATSGNMNTGSMKQAWECLKILPPTTEIKKEMDLIEAAHTLIYEYKVLDRPGMVLMPIQIRQSKNRLELISKLINTKRDMYRDHKKVLELVRKLGYGDDLLAKVKAVAMMASAALVEEDYLESYQLCQIAGDLAHDNAKNSEVDQAVWQICLNLGKMDAFDDVNRRLDILSMAMTLSPVENIQDVLAVWRKLDQDKPDQIALAQLGATNYNNGSEQTKGWSGLLHNATKQWHFSDLLSGDSEASSVKRKRDILRDAVGGWLF